MANEIDRDKAREDAQGGGAMSGGRQVGGGPSQSDMDARGGSSGSGGYGRDQNTQNQGAQRAQEGADRVAPGQGQTRGERFDERQGGGRGADSVRGEEDDLARDQRQHQDRGQSDIERSDEAG